MDQDPPTPQEVEPITTRDRGDGYRDIIVTVDGTEHVLGTAVFIAPLRRWVIGIVTPVPRRLEDASLRYDIDTWARRYGRYPTRFCTRCKDADRVDEVPDEIQTSHLPWDTVTVPDDSYFAELCESCLAEVVLDPDL